ncbi:BtrH N-terminal domain-containing protein [Kitasatospora sp. NPDC001309]|uniref:BtrH N-terminal domain-containing protein n=1 Tax=Kitasatospora sp. NPDC001309 TaxID=3364013 RepID=UPI00368ADD71
MGTTAPAPYSGDHCESTALVNMLRTKGIELSEPLVFGLGQGLSFLYWHSKQMPGPFLGGRVKPDHLIRNAVRALGLELHEQETTSRERAEAGLLAALDAGEVVGLKLDRFHLDYAEESHHFAAHYVTCVGYDGDAFLLAETAPLGVRRTSRQSLREARAAKGPMSSRNLAFRLGAGDFDPAGLPEGCRGAVLATARDFLAPPITNLGFKGIAKTGSLMRRWSEQLDDPVAAVRRIGVSMEDGGTGGGFFRALWARFLDEAHGLTGIEAYRLAAADYRRTADRWTEVATLLRKADEASLRGSLEEAAAVVGELAGQERAAMTALEEASR